MLARMSHVGHLTEEPRALPRPGRPGAVRVVAADGAALVTWEPPEGGAPVTGYEIVPRYGTLNLVERAVTADATVTEVRVAGLVNGETYTIGVVALNRDSKGVPALSQAFEPNPPPAAPASVLATPGEQSATVQWTQPASGGPVVSYHVTVAPPDVQARQVPSTQTSVLVPGLKNRVRYTFTVTATNATGESVSSPSNPVWAGDDAPGYLFPLQFLYLLGLGLVAFLYALHYPAFAMSLPGIGRFDVPPIHDAIPATVASVPISIPWFGALGAVLTGLYGVFEHAHRDWQRRFNAWYIARPFTGAALGSIAFIIFLGVIRATGVVPSMNDPVGRLIYFAIAFVVGFREQTFRDLVSRVTDLLVGPGVSVFRPLPVRPQQPAQTPAARPAQATPPPNR
jgi:hypothetical protein